MAGRAAYPGTFNPLTVAHLAIAEAAWSQLGLGGVDLVVSRRSLAKESVSRPRLEHRMEVLRAAAASRPWLGVRLTEAQLLADLAAGYDVLVLGADKWAQATDISYYGSEAERDAALARLPALAVAPRPPHTVPHGHVLALPDQLALVSSSAVREGMWHWMAPEAAAFDRATGAWSDPARYEREHPGGRSRPGRRG